MGGRRVGFFAVGFVVVVAVMVSGLGMNSAGADTASCLATASRLVAPHSFKGLIPRPHASVYTDPTQLATSGGGSVNDPLVQQDIARWRQEGFVSGVAQLYNPPKHRRQTGFAGQALASAVQLADETQAATESNAQAEAFASLPPKIHWVHFTDSAIHGSIGLLQRAKGRFGGATNLYFNDGPYAYFVGEAAARGTGRKEVVRAATRLYRRVLGMPPCA